MYVQSSTGSTTTGFINEVFFNTRTLMTTLLYCSSHFINFTYLIDMLLYGILQLFSLDCLGRQNEVVEIQVG